MSHSLADLSSGDFIRLADDDRSFQVVFVRPAKGYALIEYMTGYREDELEAAGFHLDGGWPSGLSPLYKGSDVEHDRFGRFSIHEVYRHPDSHRHSVLLVQQRRLTEGDDFTIVASRHGD
jgi:hypothetical protein